MRPWSGMAWFTSESESESDEDQVEPRRSRKFRPRMNFSQEDDFRFKEKFRLSKSAFEFTLSRIGALLRHETNPNHALSAEQQLMTALAWLGNGSQYHAVGRIHGISKATVHRCVQNVCRVIVEELMGEMIRWPQDASNIAPQFQLVSSTCFPNVAGLIDGSLINIDAPTQHEEAFVDRHGNHSINVLAVCGPHQEFYYVTAKWPGSVHDARILRNCSLARQWNSGWRPFENAVILGDSGFGLSDWIIPPITAGQRNSSTERFLRAHKSTRRIVENAFSVWKERFPCLNYLRLEPIQAAMVILATAILHNIQKRFGTNDRLDFNELREEGKYLTI